MRNFLTRRNDNDNWGLSLFDEFDNFFKPVFFESSSSVMRTDIKQTENGYEFSVALPGFDKKDINLGLENGYLTISAKQEEKQEEQNNYIRRERAMSCSRSFYVGDNLATEDIKARYQDGILSISVPKKEKEKLQNKNIQID